MEVLLIGITMRRARLRPPPTTLSGTRASSRDTTRAAGPSPARRIRNSRRRSPARPFGQVDVAALRDQAHDAEAREVLAVAAAPRVDPERLGELVLREPLPVVRLKRVDDRRLREFE